MPDRTDQRIAKLEERIDAFARRLREAEETMSNLALQVAMQRDERSEQFAELSGQFALLDAKLDKRFESIDGLAKTVVQFIHRVEADEEARARGRR